MRTLALLVVAATVVAGCSGSANKKAPADPSPVNDLNLVATATTGILRGVVVDDAIRPLTNVTVELAGNGLQKTTLSTPAGAFGFDALPAGSYLVKASKAGFFAVQQTAPVAAGVAEPPIVKLQMRVDTATTPYVQGQTFDGFVECTTSVLVLCGAPNLVLTDWCNDQLEPIPPECLAGNVTNDRFTNDFYFADNASLLQFEMAWETNQAASPEMYFELEELDSGCAAPEAGSQYEGVSAYNNTHGTSPIYATVNATQVAAWKIGTKCPIYFSVFSGGAPGVPCVPATPAGGAICAGVGFTVEQRFTLFVHEFHGFLPAPGWRFTADGQPVVPA